MAKQGKPKIQAPSVRQRRVSSYLAEKISDIIQRGDFPGLHGLVTIISVETMRDLRDAKAWFSCLNQDPEEVLKILRRHIFEIQGELYRGATMRIVPKIRFYVDHSEEYSSHINQVIDKLGNGQN